MQNNNENDKNIKDDIDITRVVPKQTPKNRSQSESDDKGAITPNLRAVFIPSSGENAGKPQDTTEMHIPEMNKKDDKKEIEATDETRFFSENKSDEQATMEVPVVESDFSQIAEQPIENEISKVPIKSESSKERPMPKKGKKCISFALASVVSVILCTAVIFGYVFPKVFGGGNIMDEVSAVIGEPPKNINVLLVGTDAAGYRTDTIMVATYDADTQAMHVIQIPRDTYVKNNGRRDKKINSAYFSGIDTLKEEIFKAFGIEIHRYLAVELNGFKQIIDKIGGVEVDVPLDMDYDDPAQDLHIHIPKGRQLLNGEDAEGFVRYRKGNDGSSYPLGDIDRMKAQKQFIMNTIAKVASVQGVSKIPGLIDIIKNNIKTDIPTQEATSYAAKLLSVGSENINFYTAPGQPVYKYGGWYYFVDAKENQKLVIECFNGENNTKAHTPVYLDMVGDSETAGESYDDGADPDISDDERDSYYSPDRSEDYYDDEDEAQAQKPDDNDDDEINDRPSSPANPGTSGTTETPPKPSQSTGNEKPDNNNANNDTSAQSPSQVPPATQTSPDDNTGAPEIDFD